MGKNKRKKPMEGEKMEVMYFVSIGYRKQCRAIIYAECIEKEFKKSIRFKLTDGSFVTVKRVDIISIE